MQKELQFLEEQEVNPALLAQVEAFRIKTRRSGRAGIQEPYCSHQLHETSETGRKSTADGC